MTMTDEKYTEPMPKTHEEVESMWLKFVNFQRAVDVAVARGLRIVKQKHGRWLLCEDHKFQGILLTCEGPAGVSVETFTDVNCALRALNTSRRYA